MTILCSRCIYDELVPGISFDSHGVCNYCHTHDELCVQYPGGDAGEKYLHAFADEIRREGKGKKYDCIVGVSGGCDSSYMLHVAKKILNLRPLAVHFDNTYNTDISVENIKAVLQKLDVDLHTYTVDAKEYDDIYKSFFKAAVPDIEAPTDIALAAALNLAAEQHGIKYILEGHNFRTEGVSPLGWLYMDGKYVAAVHEKYGTVPLKTYPNMKMADMLRWMIVRGIRKFRPLWYMDYNKEDIKSLLADTYGWRWYGGHHLENKFTAFFHSYFLPKRYGVDARLLGFAAQARTGMLSREEALRLFAEPPKFESVDLDYICSRMGFSREKLNDYMTQPFKTYRDYPNYKKTFERLRPFFWLMAKMNRIPMSFYMKYTKQSD